MTDSAHTTQADASPERQPHAALDRDTRARKARKIVALLGIERIDAARRILEIGCGSGLIAGALSRLGGGHFDVHAVDVVDNRVDRDGYEFTLVPATTLPFAAGTFDIVISNHVIEHVGDLHAQRDHLREINRVLAAGGIAYLAVPNRWRLVEPHFRLPLLSWLPLAASDRYVRATGRGSHYDCLPPSHAQALALFDDAGLLACDRTLDAVRETLRIEAPGTLSRLFDRWVPDWMPRLAMPIMPTFVFLLRTRAADDDWKSGAEVGNNDVRHHPASARGAPPS